MRERHRERVRARANQFKIPFFCLILLSLCHNRRNSQFLINIKNTRTAQKIEAGEQHAGYLRINHINKQIKWFVMEIEIKMYSLTERERRRERMRVRGLYYALLFPSHPLSCCNWLCTQAVCVHVCCVCVWDYINLSLFSPYAYLFWYFMCMCMRVHKNNPFTGWFNFLLGVCMRVCMRVFLEAGTHLVTIPETVA